METEGKPYSQTRLGWCSAGQHIGIPAAVPGGARCPGTAWQVVCECPCHSDPAAIAAEAKLGPNWIPPAQRRDLAFRDRVLEQVDQQLPEVPLDPFDPDALMEAERSGEQDRVEAALVKLPPAAPAKTKPKRQRRRLL